MSSTRAPSAPARSPRSVAADRRRVIGATIIGTTIEWYDFFIYAFAANLVFGQLFFEPAGPGMQQILSLLTIGLSFLFRPLGAFLAGHFGDKLGRRPILVITLLGMGGATTLIGALPDARTAGISAAIILVLLRVVQGICAGGEWGGAVLMSVEHAGPGQRGRFGMYPQLGVPGGMLLASAMLALMSWIAPGEAFFVWGWRVPFLASLILVAVGWIVRMAVEESPVFNEIKEVQAQESAPIARLFAQHWKLVVLAALVFAGNSAVGYMVTGGFVQGLASRPVEEGGLGFARTAVQLAVLGGAATWLTATFVSGYLADAIGRKRTYLLGWILQGAAVIPLFELVKQGPFGVFLGCALLAIGLGLTYGPQAAWYAEIFPASVRFSGVSISYAIGAIIGGAFAPTIAQGLLQSYGTTWAITVYLVIMTIVGLIATLALRDRPGIPLDLGFEASGGWETWKPGDPVDAPSAAEALADGPARSEPKLH